MIKYALLYQFYAQISLILVRKCSVRLLSTTLTSKLLVEKDVTTYVIPLDIITVTVKIRKLMWLHVTVTSDKIICFQDYLGIINGKGNAFII